MKTIFTKTLKDGRSAEIQFDGLSLYVGLIEGAKTGSSHGLAYAPSHGVYVVGKVGLTKDEAEKVTAAAEEIRNLTPMDRTEARYNMVSEARRSGDINKFKTI